MSAHTTYEMEPHNPTALASMLFSMSARTAASPAWGLHHNDLGCWDISSTILQFSIGHHV
jgi:hypothetical protein